jgi:CheY-like chemotaxis protein
MNRWLAGHVLLIEKNLRRACVLNEIIKLDDGGKAVDYLFGEGEYASTDNPAQLLILLDMNLPVLSGLQVLQRIKADERTRRIPVVMLTTTDSPQEIESSYSFSNFPLSWHWGHFWGLQRPSLVYPQVVHFHVAINKFLRFISDVAIGHQ